MAKSNWILNYSEIAKMHVFFFFFYLKIFSNIFKFSLIKNFP